MKTSCISQNPDAVKGIHKLYYEYGCLQMVLDNSTINSYNSYLH